MPNPIPFKIFSSSFTKTISSGCDTEFFKPIVVGTGMAVAQNNGNLVITTGTTANAETILRTPREFNGQFTLREAMTLSQRIANNTVSVEMVDVIGDNLDFVINSTTSVTVTIPNNPFNDFNIGQSVSFGALTGTAGTIPGRYAIASVSGDNVTFTVSGFPASGSGTVSLYGWNFIRLAYDGTTATNAKFDCGRNGWASGDTTLTINTTSSPGHAAVVNVDDGIVAVLDQLLASTVNIHLSPRGSRAANVPNDDVAMVIQIRATNGSTAPASTTTATIGFVKYEPYDAESVSIASVRPQSFNHALPVTVVSGIASSNRVAVSIDGAGITGSTSLNTQGAAAHDAVIAGNPNYMGGIARTANATGVANGDAAGALMNVVGAQVMLPYAIPESTWQYGSSTAVTNTTDVAVKAAAAAGIRNYMTGLQYHNTSATASTIVVKDGSTVIWACQAPASMTAPANIQFPVPLRGTAATALNVAMLTTATNTFVAAQGFIAP